MSKRCSLCILPAALPGLTLDQNGRCTYCREFETRRARETDLEQEQSENRKEHFESIIRRIKGKGTYDCLVPLSGGKDSCYVLYVLVKEYNIKPLTFNFNNGFQHIQAARNIENLVNKLGVDLIVYKPSQDMMRRLFRTFLLRAGEFCTPCNMLIDATSFRIARQNGIKTIMSGHSQHLDPGLEGVSAALYYDRKYYFQVAKGLITRRERGRYLVPPYTLTAIRRLIGKGPHIVDVIGYLRPSVKQIHQALEEIGWERPAGAIQHGDCLLNPLKEYIYYRKWGCNEVTALYSALVRSGEIAREEALSKAAAEECPEVPAILPEFLTATGTTENEFEQAMKRNFREIPNMRNSPFFRWAKKTVQKIERITGRK